jgi:cbb3-type cytochrome oxidase maturation protein
MTAIVLLICCSLLVAVAFLVSFIWSVKNGQYDDTYTPSIRMLFDDPAITNTDEKVDTTATIRNPPDNTTTKNPI